jgi:hypothetical protein
MRISRLQLQAVTSLLFLGLTVLTMLVPNWLEALGFDPDHGDGGAEWLTVLGLGLITVGCAALTGRTYLRQRHT